MLERLMVQADDAIVRRLEPDSTHRSMRRRCLAFALDEIKRHQVTDVGIGRALRYTVWKWRKCARGTTLHARHVRIKRAGPCQRGSGC